MKGPLLLALGLVAVTAVVGSVTAAAQGMIAPLFAAHRGGALLWAENSLLAFRNALALGADFLELDVHLTRDGEVVVIHDATLDRTTTGTGPVRERTLAELRAVRLKDRGGAVLEESVPTLDQVVALAVAGEAADAARDQDRRAAPALPGDRGEGVRGARSPPVHPLHGGDGLRGRDVAPAAPGAPRRAGGRALLGAHAAARRGRGASSRRCARPA